mgnify:FL=1
MREIYGFGFFVSAFSMFLLRQSSLGAVVMQPNRGLEWSRQMGPKEAMPMK